MRSFRLIASVALLCGLLQLVPAGAQAPADSTALDAVLKKMDATAASFRATQADFQWDRYEKVIDEVDDIQSGTIYYRRAGKDIEMMADIKQEGGSVPELVSADQAPMPLVARIWLRVALGEQNRRVHIPAEAPWLDNYLAEVAAFPKGKHDDQVDSTAQFLDWLNTPMIGAGVYEFTRKQAAKIRAAQAIPVYETAKLEYAIGSMQWQAQQEQSCQVGRSA